MSDPRLLSSIRSSFMSPASAMPPVSSGAMVPADIPTTATEPTGLTTDEQLKIVGSILDDIEAARGPEPVRERPEVPVQSSPAPTAELAPEPSLDPTPTPLSDTVPTATQLSSPPSVQPSPQLADMGALAQAVPQATLQSTDTLNPQTPVGSTIKESQGISAIQEVAAETGISLQVVEQEKAPELSPEVESFLQTVEEHHEQAPQEIVITGDVAATPVTTHHPSQPVLVLPITPDIEKEGERAGIHKSVRWLVEWSHKVVKIFSGKVIYRQA